MNGMQSQAPDARRKGVMAYPFKRSIDVKRSEDPSGKPYVTMMREMLRDIQTMKPEGATTKLDAADDNSKSGTAVSNSEKNA